MPVPNSNKDKYSIEEMMGRLKQRQDAEPELVTRADGSQALKMTIRKRRTDQSIKKQNELKKRIQIIKISAFVSIVTLSLLVLGIALLYANSSGYRDSLTGKLEVASGAKVQMEQFRMNPLEAKARKATLEWPAGHVLEKLEMNGVKASISPTAFLGKSFGGEEMVADNAKLMLKPGDASKPLRHVPGQEDGSPVKFSRFALPLLDIRFGNMGGLEKTEASLYPAAVPGKAEMRFNGGMLKLAGWPAFTLDRSLIQVRGSDLDIQSMRFQVPDAGSQAAGGSIDISGYITPLGKSGKHTLSARIESFPVSYLLGGDLGRFFVGRVDSKEIPDSNFLSFDFEPPETARLEVAVTNSTESRIDLAGFRFLQSLAVAFSDRWYEFPVFDDDVTMVVKRMGEHSRISDIHLVKRGRMVVKGEIANGEGGAIKGKLTLGIPATTLAAAGDKKLDRMFSQVREGYRWVDLEISGTGAMPEDDFKTIYLDTSSGDSTAPGQDKSKDSFEDLINDK